MFTACLLEDEDASSSDESSSSSSESVAGSCNLLGWVLLGCLLLLCGWITAPVELLASSSSLSTVRSTRGEFSSCSSVVDSSGVMQDGLKESSGSKKGFAARGCRRHLVTTSMFSSQSKWHCTNIQMPWFSVPRGRVRHIGCSSPPTWPTEVFSSSVLSSTCGSRSGYLSFLAVSSSLTRFTLCVGQCSTQCHLCLFTFVGCLLERVDRIHRMLRRTFASQVLEVKSPTASSSASSRAK